MCGTIYVCVSPVSLLVCIFFRMFKHVLKAKRLSCTQVAIHMRALPVSLLVCIFSRLLSLAFQQHASFQRNVTEMNMSLVCASVKFRLSYTIYIASYLILYQICRKSSKQHFITIDQMIYCNLENIRR